MIASDTTLTTTAIAIAMTAVVLMGFGADSAHAEVIFADSFDTAGHTFDINAGILTRTSGSASASVTSYNEDPATSSTSDWQTQLRNPPTDQVLLLAPKLSPLNKVWAGPDLDFASYLGSHYAIRFDVNPNDDSDNTWAAFTFGVVEAQQGQWPGVEHGGMSIIFREDDTWFLYDGTDGLGTDISVANGSHASVGNNVFRTVLLDVTNNGSNVTVDLSIDGVFQTSYTTTGSFTANYMSFLAFTSLDETDGSTFDDFSIIAIPTPAALPAGFGLIGLIAMRRRRG